MESEAAGFSWQMSDESVRYRCCLRCYFLRRSGLRNLRVWVGIMSTGKILCLAVWLVTRMQHWTLMKVIFRVFNFLTPGLFRKLLGVTLK